MFKFSYIGIVFKCHSPYNVSSNEDQCASAKSLPCEYDWGFLPGELFPGITIMINKLIQDEVAEIPCYWPKKGPLIISPACQGELVTSRAESSRNSWEMFGMKNLITFT